MIDDDASRIVDQWNEAPSSTIEQRSEEASGDGGDGSGALLGLELASIENSGQNPALDEDSKQFAAQSPLLGTICSSQKNPASVLNPQKSKGIGPWIVPDRPAISRGFRTFLRAFYGPLRKPHWEKARTCL